MAKFAVLFPGQGSQSVGMMDAFFHHFPETLATFEEASDALGYDLAQLCQHGPEEQLNQTEYTQPAILAASVALWRVLTNRGLPRPDVLAGHSLGEYSALVCAGALPLAEGVNLVAERGRLMQAAVPNDGAMAAVLGLDVDTVEAVCAEAAEQSGQVCDAVNFNSPEQTVIAGTSGGVAAAMQLASAKGAKRVLLLPVSVPSHCSLMMPAAAQLSASLAEIDWQLPVVPVLHNVNVSVSNTVDGLKSALTQQLHQPVRWVETVEAIANMGVDTYLECGPGRILSGLLRRIDKSATALSVHQPDAIDKVLSVLAPELAE